MEDTGILIGDERFYERDDDMGWRDARPAVIMWLHNEGVKFELELDPCGDAVIVLFEQSAADRLLNEFPTL